MELGTHVAPSLRMMRALLLAPMLLLPATAGAYQLRTDSSGTPVQFAGKQITFRLPGRVPAGLDQAAVEAAVKNALSAWSEVTGLTITTEPGDPDATVGYDSKGKNHNDIVFVEQGWSWDDNVVAATVLTIDATTHTIIDADIVLNAAQHRFRTLDADHAPGGIYDDVQNTVTHELGHALGLAHTPVGEATMYADAPKGETAKRTLKEDDIDGVRALYQAPSSPGQSGGGAGCSSAGSPISPSAGLALAALVAMGLRRRRATA
jgi:uncharacterized protein (TIGR03382 family)